MKLKQFIFALVAMLSFAFSAFAQTVTTAADLKAALSSTGAVVTLGDDITMTETISIPSGVSVTLDLNGKNITTDAACDVFEVIGTMVINDSKGTGSVTGKTYRVLYVKTKGKLTINGGRFFKNSGRVVYSGGKLIINGGSVESTPVAIPNVNTAAITGVGGTVELNGGTVTSIAAQTCDLKIAGATVEAGVSILKTNKSTEITAGTINGDITVATEAADNVTVSGGTFKDAEAVSKYMEEGKAVVKNEDGSYSVVDGLLKITSTGKCYPSLGDAFDAAVAGDVITLLDDVRVDDKCPTNQSEGITLDINGYTLSSYNNTHRVFDNGENGDITITDSKKTGKIVGYSIRNKGQMTVQGVRLEFADGIDCRGGDLYVDGCTIIGKKFAMQNDGGNTTVKNTTLSAETYAIEHRVYGASKTFTIGEGVVIESGKVHTYDIEPGQNIVFPEGYFAATIQKYMTAKSTRAYYYCALPAAVEAVKNGGTVQVLSDVELKDILTLDKAVTLDGNGKTLTSTAGRAINVDCADVVTIENLTIAGATGCERGINIINKAGTTNLKKVNVSGVSYYAVHVATSAGAAKVNIENSNLTGWAAIAAYGEGGIIKVNNSNLVGIGNATDNTSNDFATIAAASNITVNVTGGKVTAERKEGKAPQAIVCGNSTPTTGVNFVLDTELELINAEYINHDLSLDENIVTVRKEYGTNYVTTPADNGLVTLTGASEAMIRDVKYSTIAQAFAAAKEGETITLIADVAPMLASQRAITKAAVIDLNGKTLTLNNADLYFGTTTFKNGTIVVAPSVNASTAVFWMFENQALAFDNVDIVATGVTGTYLIGINGGTGTTVDIINSSIKIDNESKANLTAVICDNGTGNTVTIKDSDIDVKNIEGRFYLGGKNGAVVVENTEVDLDGVKEGFYLRAGQTLDIAGTSNVNVVLNSTEGRYGINVTDPTAKYNQASDATVNATVFIPTVAMIGTQPYASLEEAVAAAKAGDEIKMYLDVTLAESLTLPAGITFNGNDKQINGAITAGGDLTFAGHTKVTNFSAGYYERVITIGEGACLEVTGGRMTVSYGNIFNITGSVTNAKEADKANVQPSLIVEPGLSFNGDGRGVQFNVTNAYVKLGDSSSKNSGATGEFNFNFNNSIVEFTKTLKTYEPTKTGLDPEFRFNAVNSVVTFASHLELWRTRNNFVLNNTDLTVGGSFANAGGITVENGSNFVVNAPIMSSHGGNTGTINVLGGTFELKDSNQDWENAGTMKVAVNGKVITNDFKCVGEGQIVVDATDIPDNTDVTVVDGNGAYNFKDVTTVEGSVVATSFENGDVVIFKTYAKIGDTYYKSFQAAINAVKAGEIIEMVDDCSEVVSINKSNVAFTIDGAEKTYTGKIEINVGQNVTVKNLNFVHEADDNVDFIANVGSPTGKNYNTTLMVDGCSFTGNSKGNVVAVRTIHPTLVTIKNSTGTGLHSMLQNTGGQVVTVDGVTVAESNGGLAIGSPNGQVTVKNSNLTTATYGVRLDANNTNAPGAILENNKINAYIPVSVRKATANYNLTFNGNESEYTATNNDGKWCAICTTEYEEGVALNQPTGKVKVVVNAALPQSGLYGNHVEGSLTAAYTGADGYWGECGGNANYSFELKFFNGETFMGSTSLNDVDNIIDGDVNATWNIMFNTASNTDPYWTMSWEVAPSVEMQPNRVEQWVDGVKVAECAIQLNGPDNLNPIATAVVDAEGNLVKCYPTLEAAVAAGNNVAILKAGTYKLMVKDGITITGAVEGVEFANIGAFGCNGANVTFNNVTFTYANNSQYKGLQHSGDLVYNNCTFNGQVFLYGNSETFNNCTFNTTDAANYNVWTYGAKNVAFNECTFNSAGKSVLIYAESTSVFNNVAVTNSTFNASQAVDGKAAIELDSSLTAGANLTITNSTATGFGTGNVSGNSLWNNKKGNANAANNDITIVVDGNFVLAPVYDAKIGDVQHRSLQEAIDAVQEGETITMLADVEYVNVASTADKTTSINVPAGKKFTLDLNGKTIYGENSSNSSFAFMTICSGADVTIDDTSAEKTGKIAYTSTRETPNENHEGYTIRNKGNLTLNGGTVANTSPLASNGYEVAVTTAIDNCSSSGAVSTFTMNGGVVVSNTYFAIRSSVYAYNTNGATSAIVALNGGTVHGLHFCDWGSKNLDYQVAIAAGAVVEHGNYPGLTEQALRLAVGANTSKVAIDIAEEAQINGTIYGAAAKIGTLYYTKLQKAIDAVQNGETITLIADNKENVTVVQAPDMAFTIDGNDKTMKGTITVNGKSAAYATAGLTIKNVNFVADGIAAEACINLGVKGDNTTRYTSNVTVDGCTFTGTDMAKAGIKNYTGGCKNVTITNSTATGMHSLAQFKTSYGVTLTKNTVTECKNGISVDGSTGVTVTECTVDVAGYGIRANGGSDVTVTSNNVKAFTPVVVRSVTANSSFTFNGENTMVAADETGKWMVIGDEEYEAGKTLPAESTANVVVALNDANLSYTGIHGAGLAGAGTAEDPYLINNVVELQMLRDKVNSGVATKFNAPGVWVALNANIDLAGINWVGIGTATADHGFMSNFDGKTYKFQNLTITDPALDSEGYAYAGLFGVTEGTDKNNQNVIKNLTIENVTINTTGNIVAAAIAYPYYTNVDNVKVCGDIAIKGGDYTAGVLAYTRRCVNASNLAVEGNEGSYIEGAKVVGGVISDIQMNGGLKAVYSNFSAKNVAVSGAQMVGGISGNIAIQTLNGATVENVTLTSGDARVGTVAGCFGGTSTITDVTVNNVTGATAVIGATYNGEKAVEARIGDTYYETFAAAYEAAQAGQTVTMLVDLTIAESLAIDKSIAIDGNGRTLTYTGSGASARAITVENTAQGVELAISNLTVDCTSSYCQRGINYNTNGKLTLDNVTVKGTNVTYALNLPGSADEAEVTINNSNLTGNIALNVWGENSTVNVENTTLTAVDNSTAEGYAAVKLNNDGATAAEGTVINITGGKIDVTGTACEDTEAVSNATSTGEINISESTVVNGEVTTIVAVIRYNNGYSYSFQTLEAAIAKAEAGETVTLLRNVTVAQPVAINKAITLDGNGKAINYTGSNRAIEVANIADADIDVTIKNLTINNTASYTERGINYNENGTLTLENVTVNGEHTTYAINLPGMSQNAKVVIKDSKFTGLIALNIWGANTQVTAENSEFYSVDNSAAEGYAAIKLNNNGSTAANNSTVVINGGKVIAKDNNGAPSIAVEDCTNGSTVTISETTEVVGSTTKSVAIISYGDQFYTFSTIEEAIATAKAGETIKLISDVTISYGARDLLATAAADKSVVIDGNGCTLTLNSTDSDWSSIGLADNNKLVLKNMTINKAGKGATSGAWNTHAIIFSTAVEMENVTVNNAVAVAADAAFTNVAFNEANGYYSLWIEANGQTVTVKGGSMTATNGGRGIKVADQYINNPAKVTLSVDGTAFSTAKKAAVLVSSKAGAEITAANVNIANVAEDKVNFVWVDGDWATYFGNVTVNGAPAVMEDAASFVAAVTVNGAVKAYYATIVKAIEAVQDGEEVALVADVTVTNNEIIWIRKSVTINGNGHSVTSNANRVFRIGTGNIEVTLNDVNMVSTAKVVYPNDVRGISIDPALQDVVMTLNNCSVDFTDPSANDWAYAVNVSGNGTGHTVTVNGGSYEGANVINAHGANNTITVKGATLTSTYPASDVYYGACFWVLQNQGSSVVAEGNTFEADNAIVFNVGTGTAVTESENVDNTNVYVAKVGNVYYHSVNEAINAAENGATVQLLGDRRIDEAIAPWAGDSQHKLEKSITIQGYANFGTTLTGGMFIGYNDGTVRDNTITVKGINFVGKGVVVANQKNVVIEGNKFTGIDALVSDKHANSNCAVLVIGSKNDMSIAATVKNNVIEDVANAGIYMSQVGAVVVEGNTVTGTKHNALTVSAAATATVDVKNNTFAQWGLGGEGRAMRISGAATVNANENVMSYEGTMPEEFVKVTGATAFNASANYWNGESLLTEGLLAGVDPLTVAKSYYTDAEKQNLVEFTATKSVAKIGKTYYVTLAEALEAAQAGDTVTILAGEYTGGLTVKKAITVEGATDADGNNLVTFNGKLSIQADGATVKNLNFTNSGTAAYVGAKNVTIDGCSLVGSNGLYQSYTSGLVTFKNSYIKGGTYGIHFDGSEGGEIVVENCTVIGWTSFAKAIKKVTITDTEFAEGNYNFVRLYQTDITIEGCTFNEEMMVDLAVDGATATVADCTVEGENKTVESLFYGADIVNSNITVDGKLLVRVAKIGDVYYETLQAAIDAAETGATVTMVDDIETSAAGYATIGKENYAVLVAVKEKEITLDLNGKSVTVTPTAEELANAENKMLMSVFGMDTNGKLTLTGNGSVKVNANGANVYSLVAAYGEGSAVVIENGNYEADKVMSSGSLIYSHELITVMGGTFNLGNIATGANGSPWIFNTIGQNYTGVKVVGGTYPTDINHQFWANEVLVPEAYALKNNGDGTWTVVDAVAYTNEKATSRGASWRHVGYASLEDAIAATGKYNCQDNTVTMIKDITLEPITVANGVKVAIDLNGKTISGTDNGTASFGLITNKGDLTINGTGAITLTATQDRGWNAYSSVISNQPGGKLTVNDGTIQHLGGTSMAYAIDNLTNGKGTYAETEINGGIVKSAYIAIRQFLNGVEAENILNVNGGTLEGKYSIFFQDPSKNANSGTLYVDAEATLNASVYLGVTEGSTEWPVEVEVAVAALKGESTVVANNVPANYHVTKYPTAWIVECSKLGELTIDEADYAETGYINLVEKTVETLTYVRNFENDGWQSLYLPFGFTITEAMAAEFEFAYIYNASYKNKETVIDFVKVGEGFELAANYPYMIRAKEAGEKVIVVENAVLEVTKNETIDCSTVFEKFTFAGNYVANFAPEASDKKKYYVMDGGEWNDLDTLNPFRFFLQIEYRNGSAFVDDAQSIRMRSVNAYGEETTGIDGVDAEQAGDFIFDIHGRRVLETVKGGMYIKGGKKFIAQ